MPKNMSTDVQKHSGIFHLMPLPLLIPPPMSKTSEPLLETLLDNRNGLPHHLYSSTPLPCASTKISLFSAGHKDKDPILCFMPQWQAPVNQDWDVVGSREPQSSIQFLVHQEGSGCKHSHGALPFTLETEYNRLCKAKWSERIKGKLAHTVPLSEAYWPVHCPTEGKGKHTTGNSMLQDLPIMSIHTPVHDIYLDPPLSFCVLIQRH